MNGDQEDSDASFSSMSTMSSFYSQVTTVHAGDISHDMSFFEYSDAEDINTQFSNFEDDNSQVTTVHAGDISHDMSFFEYSNAEDINTQFSNSEAIDSQHAMTDLYVSISELIRYHLHVCVHIPKLNLFRQTERQ